MIEFSDDGCARPGNRLTFDTASGIYRLLDNRPVDSPEITHVDLAEVSLVDSAGLALLLEWQARQKIIGRSLRMVNAPDSLMSLARLSEAVELLNLSDRNATI